MVSLKRSHSQSEGPLPLIKLDMVQCVKLMGENNNDLF